MITVDMRHMSSPPLCKAADWRSWAMQGCGFVVLGYARLRVRGPGLCKAADWWSWAANRRHGRTRTSRRAVPLVRLGRSGDAAGIGRALRGPLLGHDCAADSPLGPAP